jgi:hypothetical protein
MDVAKLLWDGREMGACLFAGSVVQVMLAAIDYALKLLCDLHGSGATARAGCGDGTTVYAELQLKAVLTLRQLSRWVPSHAGHKPAVAAALLQKERLQLWWGCVERLHGGKVCCEVASLLLLAATKEGPAVGAGGTGGKLGISSAQAAEVRLRVCVPRGLWICLVRLRVCAPRGAWICMARCAVAI